jgi:cell division initiation protein
MKFTPLDIRHAEFSSGLSGYNKKEVREFLAQIADDAEEYERQLRGLQDRIAQLEEKINELREGEETLRRAVVSAEKIGNEMRVNAEREAQLVLKEAEAAKEKLLREALQKARDVRLDIEKARSEKAMFFSQFRALLATYLDSIERYEDKTIG